MTVPRIEMTLHNIDGHAHIECTRCGCLVLDGVGHAGYHKRLDDLFAAIERSQVATFQTVIILFVGVLAALIIGVVA